jgi:regulator of RNase E activity RraA
MSTVAKRNGVTGCVCDSQVRDCVKIIEMGFPVYYSGIRPLDSKGRAIVTAYDVPVRCGEVLVNPGDIIYADFDGIVVIPKTVELGVFEKSTGKS